MSHDCVFDELPLLVQRLELDNAEDPAYLEDAVRRRRISENNVAAYSFLGLRALNDGHIFPLNTSMRSGTYMSFTNNGARSR